MVLVHPPRFNHDHFSCVQVLNSRALTWQSTFFYWANLVRAWSSLISQLLLFQGGDLLWPWYPCSNDTGTQCRYSVPWCSGTTLKNLPFPGQLWKDGQGEDWGPRVCAASLLHTAGRTVSLTSYSASLLHTAGRTPLHFSSTHKRQIFPQRKNTLPPPIRPYHS